MAPTNFLIVADDDARMWMDQLGYRLAKDAIADRRGCCVRDVPHRLTFATELAGGLRAFRKIRDGRPGDALREWDALRRLPSLGVPVPRALFLARSGRRTAVGMREVPGRPLAELLADGVTDRRSQRYLIEQVAPIVRRLHRAGLAHRDMYWGHWIARELDPDGPGPTLIDVERVFRPWHGRRRRWFVKDLAGLVASWPCAAPTPGLGLRFLRAYFGGSLPRGWKRFARDALRKAARIRSHVPRWGAPPDWA